MLECGTTRVERAEQINIDHGLEPICRHPERRRRKISGCTAYNDVDPAEFVVRCGDSSSERLVVSDIGREPDRSPATRSKLPCSSIELLLRPPNKPDLRAVLSEALGNRKIYPAPSTCNEGDFPV